VRAFISAVDSFCYRQLTAVIRDKCCSGFTLFARFPPWLNALYIFSPTGTVPCTGSLSGLTRKYQNTVMDLVNALPGNSFVNTAQYATTKEAVFSVDLTDMPIDWLDSDHVIYVYCRSTSVSGLYK
jgi:hypothetical protein